MNEEEVNIRQETLESLEGFGRKKDNLIPILQKVQDRFGYLPKEAIAEIAGYIAIPAAEVYSTATFYNQFRFNKPGKHSIQVCMGTACHVKGGGDVLDAWKRELDIDEGETTPDGNFDLERAACIGCCVMAPVTVVDGEIHGKVKIKEIAGVIKSLGEHEDS